MRIGSFGHSQAVFKGFARATTLALPSRPRLVQKPSTVRVMINGEERDVPEGVTIRELVAHLGLTGPVAVEVNRVIVPRAEHPSQRLAENDVLELVHFVGGG